MELKFIIFSSLPIFLSILILWIDLENRTFIIQLFFVCLLSVICFIITFLFIPIISPICLKRDLKGKDINKNGTEFIPESLGLVCGIIYLLCIIMLQPLFSNRLGEYNAALTSICLMILLGFVDDVLDARWSMKILLSFLATLPLLIAYSGPTTIIIPKPFQNLLGFSIQLGYFYHFYMSFIGVFCTNSINILAGINGLEVGQSLIIACSILLHNIIQLNYISETNPMNSLLSIFLILPFIATSCALLYYNWYPSKVFVGDTYTYFAGMTLAVVGILGHCSKTLMLFFIPQFINFIISLPQLFHIIPCPRHRLAKFNKETGKLETTFPQNLNLLNLFLYLFGPMTEQKLCISLLFFQILCSSFAFFIRYQLSTLFYY